MDVTRVACIVILVSYCLQIAKCTVSKIFKYLRSEDEDKELGSEDEDKDL